MTPQEKAKELAISATKYVNDKGEEVYNTFCEAACMQMHEWDKQKFIKKAWEFWIHKFPYIGIDTMKEFADVMEEE